MRWISDNALDRLSSVAISPDFGATRYRLLREIARGGMGSVYLCTDTELDREVAIKVIDDNDPNLVSGLHSPGEARVIARLEHPGIIPVHDVGQLSDGRTYYVMKYVRGSRLDEFNKGVSSLTEKLRIFQGVCTTVAFAHSHGVIHRDLKPQNIMVGAFGEVLVIDWGIAKVLRGGGLNGANDFGGNGSAEAGGSKNSEGTANGVIAGTPAYMAPEQARGEIDRLDRRTDVYALGAILYFLLTGRVPSSQSPQSLRREVPKAIEAVCLKAMATEPDSRFENASELSEEVGRYLDREKVHSYSESQIERLVRFVSKHRFIVLLVIAYLLMRILLIFYSTR